MATTKMTLQELCYREATRANRAENRLKTERKELQNVRRYASVLERKIATFEAETEHKTHLSELRLNQYHRYWLDRYNLTAITHLAAGLAELD